MKTTNTSMQLVHFDLNDKTKTQTFKVNHNNGDTNLDQHVSFITDRLGNTKIELIIDGFPKHLNGVEAIIKYGDWLERIGIALKREAKRTYKRGLN